MDAREMKVAVARAALAEVCDGMRLGLGTGTTSEEFVRLLAVSEHARSVRSTCTSQRTEELARSLGLTIEPLSALVPLDLAVDGADEVDTGLRLIKGRGGALLREKIVEQQAVRFIVIVDESKIVEHLGSGPLPVEVTPFAADVLLLRFAEMDLQPELRLSEGAPRVTDEGNRIIDVRVPRHAEIGAAVGRIRALAGVIDTGFFPTEATEVLIASETGVRRMVR